MKIFFGHLHFFLLRVTMGVEWGGGLTQRIMYTMAIVYCRVPREPCFCKYIHDASNVQPMFNYLRWVNILNIICQLQALTNDDDSCLILRLELSSFQQLVISDYRLSSMYLRWATLLARRLQDIFFNNLYNRVRRFLFCFFSIKFHFGMGILQPWARKFQNWYYLI